jgi:hypothetical protein
LNVAVKAADAALKDRPAMVSAIGNGSVVRQYEVLLDRDTAHLILDDLQPGAYDVRIKPTA